jgi:two-component system, cell cycle response regulator
MQLDGYVYALLLTARDAKEHIIAGLEAGADDYLIKPVHEPELIARLNTGRRILALEHSLRAANERNRILSITDALTGAFNRRYLMEQLPRELERCRRYAYPCRCSCATSIISSRSTTRAVTRPAMMCCSSSPRASRNRSAPTATGSRAGGEEFLIVLPETGTRALCSVAEKDPQHDGGTAVHDARGDVR